jgi:hypothetical protein
MTEIVTLPEIEKALLSAIPAGKRRDVERTDDMVWVTLPPQPGIPWELQFGFEGVEGEGEQLLLIVSDELKYERMSIEPIDRPGLAEFVTFLRELLDGTIAVELSRFRSDGKLWRTRLLDQRKPDGEQVIYRYYRRVFHWWRPLATEIVTLGTA